MAKGNATTLLQPCFLLVPDELAIADPLPRHVVVDTATATPLIPPPVRAVSPLAGQEDQSLSERHLSVVSESVGRQTVQRGQVLTSPACIGTWWTCGRSMEVGRSRGSGSWLLCD